MTAPPSSSSASTTRVARRWPRRSRAKLAGDRVAVRSAGSDPADEINPAAVEAMAEVGIDIHEELPKLLTHRCRP